MAEKKRYEFVDRELSWLSFNGRVLQEARDRSVPLYERLTFLAIYSSNLDEFFRVRVASLRSLLRLNEKTTDRLGIHPGDLLRRIHDTVTAQQEQFGATFRNEILPELADRGVYLIDETDLSVTQSGYLAEHFDEHVRTHANPVVLGRTDLPFLEDRQVYLAVELWPIGGAMDLSAGTPQIGLVEVPGSPVERFVRLPDQDGRRYVMFVDDVVRHHLPELFPDFEVGGAFAVKLSRDADLYLDDEYTGSIAEQIRRSLDQRERGLPCRFLYDLHAPYHVISYLKQAFDLDEEDLVQGGRYHNLHDLADFPRFDLEGVRYEELAPLEHPVLAFASSMFGTVAEADQVIHFPYQKFDYVLRFLREAVDDPAVDSIWTTLYRTAPNSRIVGELIRAAEAGKRVTAFVELKARFDEASNLDWAAKMEAAGVRTLYSFRDLKVHAKLMLVGRRENGGQRWYCYLGTGNLNERTARVYADHGLFTADPRLTRDVRLVFAFLSGEEEEPDFEHLLVAPFGMRSALLRMIDREIDIARAGRRGRLIAKMNALEDEKMIHKLYDAGVRNVEMELIVRGICCLVPGVPLQSDRIRIRSIIDRFLEHARMYVFQNDGEEQIYLASADWMKRNLSRRVEVAFPIYDGRAREELKQILELQLQDTIKARIVGAAQQNAYASGDDAAQKNAYASGEGSAQKNAYASGKGTVRAQMAIYRLLEERWKAALEHRKRNPVSVEEG
jgi:polyphosphate kinase